MINMVCIKKMKLSKVLLVLSSLWFEILHATAHEKHNNNTDPGLKKRRLLGECDGKCYKNNDCANGNLCSHINQRALKAKGYDPRLANCDAGHDNGGYVCYDPWKTKFPVCPVGSDSLESCDPSGNGFFNNSNSCFDGTVYGCCRQIAETFNGTHSECLKYKKCGTFRIVKCSSKGKIVVMDYDNFCFESKCLN